MRKVLSFFVAIQTWHDECNNDCLQFINITNQTNKIMKEKWLKLKKSEQFQCIESGDLVI